jgi:hypothetical protein
LVATDLAAGATGDRWSSAWRAGTTVDKESGDPAAGAAGVDERRASRACSTCGGENSHSRAWRVHLLLDWYSSAFSLGSCVLWFHLPFSWSAWGTGGWFGRYRRCPAALSLLEIRALFSTVEYLFVQGSAVVVVWELGALMFDLGVFVLILV